MGERAAISGVEVIMRAPDGAIAMASARNSLRLAVSACGISQCAQRMAACLPGAQLVFDTIPPWLSRLTLLGLNQTATYRLPQMPWGIARDDIEPTLRRWCPGLGPVEMLSYSMPRSMPSVLTQFIAAAPVLRHQVPSLVLTRFGQGNTQESPL